MSQRTYLKVPFVWEEPKTRIEVSPRLTFEPVKATQDDRLISTVARVMAESVDASDRRRAAELDLHAAVEVFLNSTSEDFSYQDEWWQFGINEKGDIVGKERGHYKRLESGESSVILL
jgi:hypothetical protein